MVSLRSEDGGGGSGNRIFSLHGTAPSAGLRRVRVLVLADGAPHRRNLQTRPQNDISTGILPHRVKERKRDRKTERSGGLRNGIDGENGRVEMNMKKEIVESGTGRGREWGERD